MWTIAGNRCKSLLVAPNTATHNTNQPEHAMTTQHDTTKLTKDDFHRLDNDTNGNPRYYLPAYLAPEATARKLGAVRYRGKRYGAGWVFQTYNLQGDCDKINAASK
jgi:hypothetical protein